jgi:hypothetical protein
MLMKKFVGGLGLLVFMLYVSTPVFAASMHKAGGSTHKGKVVEAGGGKLTMTDMSGQNQHTMDVGADATITCGKKKCGLEDLKPGAVVSVTTAKHDDATVVTKIHESAKQMAKKQDAH